MTAPPGPEEGKRPFPPRDAGAGGAFRRRAAKPVNTGYSRMVQLAKVAFPLAALGILALVAAWPSFVETTPPKLAANPTDSDLVQPRYFAVDEKGQPFSLTAKRAKEKDPAAGLVDLDEPEAEMTELSGAWVTMRGRTGEYNRQTKILHLKGDVRILRDDGTEYRTEEAFSDIAAGTAWGDSYIVGQGPQGEVAGQGFRMSDRGKTMVFTNRAAAATPAGPPSEAPKPDAPASDAPHPMPAPLPTPSTPPQPAPIPPLPIPPIHLPPVSAPQPGAPVSGAPVSGAPVSGAPVPGAPVSGAPVPGAPVPGAPIASAPIPSAPIPSVAATAPDVDKPPPKPFVEAPATPTGWTPPPPRRKPIPPKRK